MIKNIFMGSKGFTLLEVTLVIILLSITMAAVTPNYVQGILRSRGEKAALDMYTIQEAARIYYVDHKAWPASIADLKSGNYLPSTWPAMNPFNNAYSMASTPLLLTVSSNVPAGIENTVASRLPASTVSGATVASSITPPALSSSGFTTWDSGCFYIANNGQYGFTHDLKTTKVFWQVYASYSSDCSNSWIMYAGRGRIDDNDGGHGCQITGITDTTMYVQAGNQSSHYKAESGFDRPLAGGYIRVIGVAVE